VVEHMKRADTICKTEYSETCLTDVAFYRTNRKRDTPVLINHEEGNHDIDRMSTASSSPHTVVKVKLSLTTT